MKDIITERPNLFEPNDYISFYVEIEGKVSAENLENAVKAAYRANEATTSKVVLKPDGAACYEKMTYSGCKVEILQEDWQEIVKANEKEPFELENGELVRSFVIPSCEKTALLIMAHHLSGDGKAIVYFIESVMKALSGAELEYRPLTLLTSQSFPQKEKLPFIAKLYTVFCNRKWQKTGKSVFSWVDYYNIHNHYWKIYTSSIQCTTLSKAETARIIKNAGQAGVSVNSYIVAAFLQADRNNSVVGIPVSVRESTNKSMTNLTSGIRIIHRYSEEYSFPENAKIIHKKVSEELKKHRWFVLQFLSKLSPVLTDAVLLNSHHCYENSFIAKVGKIMGYTGNKTSDIGITNLTVLDIPTVYDDFKVENIVFVPPAVSYANNIIGVSTINGEMTLTYHGMDDDKDSQKEFFSRGIMNLIS